jgi:acetoin utilization protein AcuB
MSTTPVTVGPEDSLLQVMDLMRLHGIRRVPVILAHSVVGLVAEGDLKRVQPSPLQGSVAEYDTLMGETPVSKIMIRDPLTVTEDSPLVEAARTLHSTKYGALPVLKDGVLVGMLTDTDLSGCLVEILTHAG